MLMPKSDYFYEVEGTMEGQYKYGDKVKIKDEQYERPAKIIGGPYTTQEEDEITYLVDLNDEVGTTKLYPEDKLETPIEFLRKRFGK